MARTRRGRKLGWIPWIAALSGLALVAGADSVQAAETGRIAGQVLDAGGGPVAGAIVLVCDAATGIPVDPETGAPFTERFLKQGDFPPPILFATTSAEGRFALEEIPAGTYRLVAQSWSDAKAPVTDLLATNGRAIDLRGVAGGVRVPSEEAERLEIRPLGSGALHLDVGAPNDETLLLASLGATSADPILGFAGWAGPFQRGMIGGNRMPGGVTIFRGLPEGEVHLVVFSADNVPGFGATTVTIRPGEVRTIGIPFVAGWSDARHEPPDSLAPLVEELESLGGLPDDVTRFLESEVLAPGKEDRNPIAYYGRLVPYLDREFELPSAGTVRLADLAAAEGYRRLLATVQEREEEAKTRRLAEMGIREEVGYEQAFRDLYRTLASRYPHRMLVLKEIDWAVVGEQMLPAAAFVETDEEFGLLCLELIARLEDTHARLLDGAVKVPAPPLPRFDPGFACLEDDRGRPVVYAVVPGGPAARAGLRPGMTVRAIDGSDPLEAIAQTMGALRRWYGFSSERQLRYEAFRVFARREVRGTIVRLELEGPDEGAVRSVEIIADLEPRALPRLPVPIAGIPDSASVSWKRLEGEIGYLRVRRISPDLVERLDKAVGALEGVRGLVVDVRGNTGGGFDAARALRNFALEREDVEPGRPRFRGTIALLLDAACVSAGEGWASWFVANGRARTFGETTAGASARKTVVTLSNGLYKVRFPVKPYNGFLDRPIERLGLEPDVPLRPSASDLAAGRDTVLEAARRYLVEAAERR